MHDHESTTTQAQTCLRRGLGGQPHLCDTTKGTLSSPPYSIPLSGRLPRGLFAYFLHGRYCMHYRRDDCCHRLIRPAAILLIFRSCNIRALPPLPRFDCSSCSPHFEIDSSQQTSLAASIGSPQDRSLHCSIHWLSLYYISKDLLKHVSYQRGFHAVSRARKNGYLGHVSYRESSPVCMGSAKDPDCVVSVQRAYHTT